MIRPALCRFYFCKKTALMHPVGNAWGLLMSYLKLNGRAKNNGLTEKVNPNCPAEVTRLISVWVYLKIEWSGKK